MDGPSTIASEAVSSQAETADYIPNCESSLLIRCKFLDRLRIGCVHAGPGIEISFAGIFFLQNSCAASLGKRRLQKRGCP
jgi:hypothetical protein